MPRGGRRSAFPALTRRLVFPIALATLVVPAHSQHKGSDGAAAHRAAGHALFERRDFDEAITELSEAVRIAEASGDRLEAGRALAERGLVFFTKADWPRMEESYEQAISALGAAGAFGEQSAAMRGLNYSPRFPWEERERRIERAWETLKKEPDAKSEGLALHQWGDILFNEGRYGLGLEKLREALPRLRASNDRSALARLLTSMGRTYRVHGRLDDAMVQYREALRIQTVLGDLSGAAQSENAIQVALRIAGHFRAGLAHARRALELATRAGLPTPIAFQRLNLGQAYMSVGEARRALPLLAADPALPTTDDILRLEVLSDAQGMLGYRDAALDTAERAIHLARELDDPYRLAHALAVRAESWMRRGELDIAYRDIASSLDLVERMRPNLSTDDRLRQNFSDTAADFVTSAIMLLTRLGRHAEALDVAERARGRALLDLLASRDITSVTTGGARESDRAQLSAETPLSHDAMRAALAGLHSTLLAFWVAPDATYVWLTGPDGVVHGRRVALTALRLRSLIDTMNTGREPSDARTNTDASRALYDHLLEPIARWLPPRSGSRLTIVPHGPLFRLPFAALRDANGHYLVERYAVHSVTSLSVLGQTSRRSTNGPAASALLVGDPATDRGLLAREHLTPLKGARTEAAAIARGLSPQTVRVLTGAAATEAAVKRTGPSARILHFATHAVVSDAGPLDSYLALTPGDGDDGRLTSAEIYDWKLDADLVVLSACRTARGHVTGDGVIGLARAFAYAGAPSLIAAVWDTPDETAGMLLPAFYAAWRRTGDLAGALRTAQLEMIAKLRAGSIVVKTPAGPVTLHERPALWAPFVLLGQP